MKIRKNRTPRNNNINNTDKKYVWTFNRNKYNWTIGDSKLYNSVAECLAEANKHNDEIGSPYSLILIGECYPNSGDNKVGNIKTYFLDNFNSNYFVTKGNKNGMPYR